MNHIFSRLILSILLSLCLASCLDDRLYDDSIVPAGNTTISASINFNNFTPVSISRADGEAIKAINSLWVVTFNQDGSFIEKKEITDFTVKDVRPNTRPDGATQAETMTGHAEFKLTLPNGKYHIYAVVNYDLSVEEIDNEKDLKNIQLTWVNDAESISQNAEMFGFFTESKKNQSSLSSFNASTVTLNGGTKLLHAWVRRAVSKLTIVYDGSNLKDNVVIYIKSATIKDIPINCPLGETNRPGNSQASPDQADPANGIAPETVLYPEGETIFYYEGEEPNENDYSIANYKYALAAGITDTLGTHSETADALYFYENVQPKGQEGKVTDKRQDVSGNNTQVSYPDGSDKDEDGKPTSVAWKDGRKYGTYVEVKAYYTCDVAGRRSRGDIIYRFMLGKNITTDYNTERNHHYKLTMKFNGYANDVDFHIDYDIPVPSMHVQPYYISYLYNHSMMFPVTIHSGHNKVVKLQAEIIQNCWFPDGAAKNVVYYSDNIIDNPDDYQWHGFLSLRKTKTTILNGNSAATATENDQTVYGTENRKYYYDHLRHRREYSNMEETGEHVKDLRESDDKTQIVPKNFTEESDDAYEVKITYEPDDPESKVYDIRVPMWTRAKQMIKSSGYTGNNPYVAYPRKALVRFTAWLDNGSTLTEEAPVTQVQRIVNPKGIYRTGGSKESFHVTLRNLPSETATEFIDVRSEGSWKAYIVRGNKDIINLDGKKEVSGKTGSLIDFNVSFTGKEGYAIIRVDYHNYTCNHLIFVRNGYSSTQLLAGGAKWHTTNLRTINEETDNPMDEGSLFKFGNLDYPIDASSNVNDKTPWTLPATWREFNDPVDVQLNIATDGYTINKDTGTKTWGEIESINYDKTFTSSKDLGVKGRVATLSDYNALLQESLKADGTIEYGYGVLYADGATECARHISAVYGYRHDHKTNTYGDEKAPITEACGMRGMFVYNSSESVYGGRNVFFPIGNSGYGFRRSNGYSQGGDELTDNPFVKYNGLLKYAGRNDFYPESYKTSWGSISSVKMRPLFWDLWRRPGAIYWLNESVTTDLKLNDGNIAYLGWDINYFSLDFYGYQLSDIHKGNTNSCAAFVRLVDD